MTFGLFALAWAIGIALGKQQFVNTGLWLAIIPLTLLAIVTLGRRRSAFHNIYWWQVLFLSASMLALGAVRMQLSGQEPHNDSIFLHNDQGWVTIEGIVTDDPDIRDTRTNLRVDVLQVTLEDESIQPASGTVLVQAPRTDAFQFGDRINATGQLVTPPEFDDFSYQDFLARQGVFSLLQFADVQTLEAGQPSVRRSLYVFRQRSHNLIRDMLPDPQASLLIGILLGIESGISPDIRAAFTATGASHVIAISGSNLAILGGLIQGVARRFLREQVAAILTAVSVILYTILVGADPAVVRAAVMVVLALIATRLRGPLDGLSALGIAAILMSLLDPNIIFDIGFQLSFLATLGLVIFVEPMEEALEKLLSLGMNRQQARNTVGALSEALIVSVAATIMTTPLIAFYFGRLSLASLPVNLLIVPAQTPLMVFGGIGVLFAHILLPLGQLFAWGSWVFLSFTIWVVRLFAELPFAEVNLQVSALSTATFYGLIGGAFVLEGIVGQRADNRWWSQLAGAFGVKVTASLGLIVIILLAIANIQMPDGRLHITFIDAGSGEAILVQTPSGRTLLIDGGTSGRRLSTALGDQLPFWQRRIDVLVVTQSTHNQVAGLVPVLERYQVEAVVSNGSIGDGDTVDAFWQMIAEQNAQHVTAYPGMQISVDDGVQLEVLFAPTQPLPEPDDTGEPLALMLHYREARVLLAHNVTEESQQLLVAHDWTLDSTVVHLPERGNAAYNQAAFLEQVNPQLAIVSVQAGNSRGLPDDETIEAVVGLGADLYRTDQHGNITITTDGNQMWVHTSE